MHGLGKRSSLPNLLKSFTGKYVLKKNTMCNYSYNKNEATMLVALWPSGCCYIFFHFWKSSVRFSRACFFFALFSPSPTRRYQGAVGLVDPGVTLPVARHTSGNIKFPSIVHPPTDSWV